MSAAPPPERLTPDGNGVIAPFPPDVMFHGPFLNDQ